MLMNPQGAPDAREMFRKSLPLMLASFTDERILASLKQVDRMVGEGDVYGALKAIRALYPVEQAALQAGPEPEQREYEAIAVGAR
jgi:flagellar protein FlbT